MTIKSLVNETMYMFACISFFSLHLSGRADIHSVVQGETAVSSQSCSFGKYNISYSTITKCSALLTFDFDEHWPTCASTKSAYWRNKKDNSQASSS